MIGSRSIFGKMIVIGSGSISCQMIVIGSGSIWKGVIWSWSPIISDQITIMRWMWLIFLRKSQSWSWVIMAHSFGEWSEYDRRSFKSAIILEPAWIPGQKLPISFIIKDKSLNSFVQEVWIAQYPRFRKKNHVVLLYVKLILSDFFKSCFNYEKFSNKQLRNDRKNDRQSWSWSPIMRFSKYDHEWL